MKYKSSNIAVIIPSANFKNIKICLKSIQRQTKKPGQTIIVFNKKKFLKKRKIPYFLILINLIRFIKEIML